MKNLLSIFGNFILIFVAAVCTMGAVISAFSFNVDWTVITLVWLITALAISLNFYFWRVRGLLILLIPVAILLLWRLPEILGGARWAAYYITSEFNIWLFVYVLFPYADAYAYELTLFFAAVGILLSFLLSIAICVRHSGFLTMLFTIPIVFVTFVLIFNYADPIYLVGLLAVYLTIIISNGLSPDGFEQRNVSVFQAILLVAILMGFTLLIAPPSAPVARADAIRSFDMQLREFASRMGLIRIRTGTGWPALFDDRWGFNTSYVGISEAGTRVIHDVSVLEVIADAPGVFYLRGYSMQYFDGNSWTINSEAVPGTGQDSLARSRPALIANTYRHRDPYRAPETVHMHISITGDVSRNIVYTPYFSFPFRHYTTEYAFEFFNIYESVLNIYARLDPEDRQRLDFNVSYGAYADFVRLVNSSETYLQIASASAQALRGFAERADINTSGTREEIANSVADFMVNFGTYTLAPFIIPLDEDFVMHFLESSRQGFCIHYATAATMMLRALGVPARFTSGFVVTVQPHEVNETVIITDRYAHAWVEVFFDDVGWLPFEVTPPATGFGLGDGRPGFGGPGFGGPAFGFEDEDFFDYMMWAELEFGYDITPTPGIGPGAEEPLTGTQMVVRGIFIGIAVAVVVAAPFIHRSLAVRHRSKQFTQDDTNASAIAAWRYLVKLRRFRRMEEIPEGIEEIVLKARYSQHRISDSERLAVISYTMEFAGKVYRYHQPLRRFWIKFIRGL